MIFQLFFFLFTSEIETSSQLCVSYLKVLDSCKCAKVGGKKAQLK